MISRNKKYLNLLLIFLLTPIIFGTIWWAYKIMNPLSQIRFIGLGSPSPVKEFVLEQYEILFYYPANWKVLLTPQGNHGDMEAIAVIVAPGRSLPNITIAHKSFADDDISLVADWGDERTRSNSSYQFVSLLNFNSPYFSGLLREYTRTNESLFSITEIRCEDLYIVYHRMGFSFTSCASQSDWSELFDAFKDFYASIRSTE